MGHVAYFLEFWDPLFISGAIEHKNFKFGMQIEHKEYSPKMLLQTTKVALRVCYKSKMAAYTMLNF